jgi:hypothetical protein
MESQNNWVCIATYFVLFDAELARNTMMAANIPCEIVNNVNSFYPSIGTIELFVQRDDVMQAKRLLNQDDEEE